MHAKAILFSLTLWQARRDYRGNPSTWLIGCSHVGVRGSLARSLQEQHKPVLDRHESASSVNGSF